MCGDGNHQGFIADTSLTRRTMLLTMSAAAAIPSNNALGMDTPPVGATCSTRSLCDATPKGAVLLREQARLSPDFS